MSYLGTPPNNTPSVIGGIPVGTLMPNLTNLLTPGYFWAEGGVYDHVANAELHGVLTAAGFAPGVLPDVRNRVLRGLGDMSGLLAQTQEDQFQMFALGTATGGTRRVYGAAGFSNTSSDVNPTGIYAGNSSPDADIIVPKNAFGTNGTPRTGSETRVKSITVRWMIKAYNAFVNEGKANLVAIEQNYTTMLNGAIRKDISAPPTNLQMPNLLLNIRQMWETVLGGMITVGSIVPDINLAGLNLYRRLRITGSFYPTVETFLMLQTGASAVDTGNNYGYQYILGSGTSLTANRVDNPGYAITAGTSASYQADFTCEVFDFNVASQQDRILAHSGGVASPAQFFDVHYYARHYAIGVMDKIRIVPNSGQIGANSSFHIEGMR